MFATELGTFTYAANLGRTLDGLVEWSNPDAINCKDKVLRLEDGLRSDLGEFEAL